MSIITGDNPFIPASTETGKAASKIQTVFRGYMVRKHLKTLHDSATQIQSISRGQLARKHLIDAIFREGGLATEDSSVSKIEALCKMYCARKKLEEQNNAATKIQSIYKGHHCRTELEEKEEAAVKIQSAYRGYRAKKAYDAEVLGKFVDFLKSDSRHIYDFLQDIQNRIHHSFLQRVVEQDVYNRLLDKMNGIIQDFKDFHDNLEDFLEKNPVVNRKDFTKEQNIILESMHEDILELCKEAGFKNLNQGLDVILGSEWESTMPETSLKSFEFFNQVFIPTGFTFVEVERESEEVHYLKSDNGIIKTDFTDNISKGLPFPTEFRFFQSKTLYNKLNGAELCIPVDRDNGKQEMLVVNGHFATDPLNLQSTAGWLNRKKKSVTKQLEAARVPKIFTKKFLEQYSVRDRVLNTPESIKDDMIEAHKELEKLKTMMLPTLVRNFVQAPIQKQIRILSLLTMDNENSNGYFLYSLVGKETPELKTAIRSCLHFSIQRVYDIKDAEVEALKRKLAQAGNDDVPYEDRVLASAMEEQAKVKSFEKAKAAKSRGSESDKAEAWLNGILKLPFGKYVAEPVTGDSDRRDIKAHMENVRRVLDESVHGHEEAKQTLLRVVGQWISSGGSQGEVLALQGPPGNGKTTFAQEGVAKALGRPFGFLPLGGITDSAYLIGHEYTYVGATWGRIADILMEAGCMNPVIYIDELDKVSQTEKGREIIGVLTHMTDSSQNKKFHDKYFSGINIDLSKALFVFSYNDESMIDPILKDRMITIRTKAHSTKDKLVIAQDYLLPGILKQVGFEKGDITISNENIEFIVENYTYEAGVRRLKEYLFQIVRELNLDRLLDPDFTLPHQIDQDIIIKCLDEPRSRSTKIPSKPLVGTVNGLFATSAGIGGLTIIQTFKTLSKTMFDLKLTGSQGDVMQESMKTALTVAQNLLPSAVKREIMDGESFGLHIHAPEAAQPKDGPSAGGAITVAIISRLMGIPIKNDVAMTGEIDLRGRITAIGGLNYKLKGAKDAGARQVFCPKENEKDLEKVRRETPELFDENFEVICVDNIHDLLRLALVEETEFPAIE